jgi:hypothetical protein
VAVEDGLRDTYAYLSAELDRQFERKSSLESRVAMVVSANVALVALFIAAADVLGPIEVKHGWEQALSILGLVALGLSTLAALIGGLPLNYPTLPKGDLDAFVTKVVAGESVTDILEDLATTTIDQIDSAQSANNVKAWAVLGAVVFASLGAGLLAVVIVWG